MGAGPGYYQGTPSFRVPMSEFDGIENPFAKYFTMNQRYDDDLFIGEAQVAVLSITEVAATWSLSVSRDLLPQLMANSEKRAVYPHFTGLATHAGQTYLRSEPAIPIDRCKII